MKKILTYGTFDLFHKGHLNLLLNAKKMGDYLIVGVSTDEFNEKKGKKCVIPFDDRKFIVSHINSVDEVIAENDWSQKESDILNHKIDVFVIGDDWEGKFDYLSKYCEVVYLKRTADISTTDLKKIIGDNKD